MFEKGSLVRDVEGWVNVSGWNRRHPTTLELTLVIRRTHFELACGVEELRCNDRYKE